MASGFRPTTLVIDLFKDTCDMTLVKDNIWFRVRKTNEYSFKSIAKDHNNVLHHFQMAGDVRDLQRWMLSRRSRPFVTSEPEITTYGSTLLRLRTPRVRRCTTATIHGEPRAHSEFSTPRCGSAFIAAKGLHFDGLVCSDSDCMQETALVDKPPYWPNWKSPFPPASAVDRQNALSVRCVCAR